jgi:hypothetical protein
LRKKLVENKKGNRETVSLGNWETAVLKIRGKQANSYSHNWSPV